jgi:hypothetical protein
MSPGLHINMIIVNGGGYERGRTLVADVNREAFSGYACFFLI